MAFYSVGQNKAAKREGDLKVVEVTLSFNRVIAADLIEKMHFNREGDRGRQWRPTFSLVLPKLLLPPVFPNLPLHCLPLSPPFPFTSLPNSVNLCVFQMVENT